MSNIDEGQSAPMPRRGRPPKRPEMRNPTERSLRRGEYVGLDGEILTRTRSGNKDLFEVPKDLIPDGFEMQWIAMSVVGNKDVVMDMNNEMLENGWRPVKASMRGFAGRFTPPGFEGHITRGGQGLFIRPAQMCEDARHEEHLKAYQQLRDRDEALMGHKANLAGSMPQEFNLSKGVSYKGRKTNLSMDSSLDGFAPRPKHQMAIDDNE